MVLYFKHVSLSKQQGEGMRKKILFYCSHFNKQQQRSKGVKDSNNSYNRHLTYNIARITEHLQHWYQGSEYRYGNHIGWSNGLPPSSEIAATDVVTSLSWMNLRVYPLSVNCILPSLSCNGSDGLNIVAFSPTPSNWPRWVLFINIWLDGSRLQSPYITYENKNMMASITKCNQIYFHLCLQTAISIAYIYISCDRSGDRYYTPWGG